MDALAEAREKLCAAGEAVDSVGLRIETLVEMEWMRLSSVQLENKG